MIVIAILAIPFVFYFNKTDFGAQRSNIAGRVYGRPVTDDQVARGARLFMLARELEMSDLLGGLTVGATNDQDALVAFSLNLLVLRHEAERLGIRPTGAQAAEAVKEMGAFRGEKGFDMRKYNEFVQNKLGGSGFTEESVEELANDQVRLMRIRQLLDTGVQISESESSQNLDQAYSKFDVSVIRLRTADFAKDIKMTDDEIAKYFDANKEQLKTDEKRKADFVLLALTEEQKKLAGKERIDALQKLADRANDLSQALLEKGASFQEVAAKMQLPVKTTGEFTRSKPDPQFATEPQLTAAAFQISNEEPNSDPIQVGDGFVTLHLAGVAPPRPLSAEEARPKIAEILQTQRTRQMLAMKAAELSHNLREAAKSGESLQAVVQKNGVAPEKVPPFSLLDEETPAPADPKAKPPESPDLPRIKAVVAELKSGEISDFLPTADGGLIAIVEARRPVEASQATAKRAKLDEQFLKGKRSVVFFEWMRERRLDAGIQEVKRS